MPTEKKVITFTVDEQLQKRLEDYRFDNRINTMSEAIRKLIEESLQRYEKKPKK
jgi:metal-responsive CopG/Arc/MetJ family transcriptional regulator